MPKRMLAAEVTRSESLAKVSLEAAHTFLLLMTRADDQGRFEGRPAIILAEIYPLRLHEVTIDALCRWLDELAAESLIHRYEVDGRPYVHFPTWGRYQRLREQSTSKWPEPNDCCSHAAPRGKAPQPAASCGSRARGSGKREAGSVSEKKNKASSTSPPAQPSDSAWESVREAFGAYGKSLRGAPSPARQRALRARARESSAESLASAVHGYWALHAGSKSNGFDASRHFTPETVFRPSTFPKYLEAYEEALARGREPPFREESAEDKVRRLLREEP